MLNCFDINATINERYDIKGSWVGRSASEHTNRSKRVICRHCNTYYIPNQKSSNGLTNSQTNNQTSNNNGQTNGQTNGHTHEK